MSQPLVGERAINPSGEGLGGENAVAPATRRRDHYVIVDKVRIRYRLARTSDTHAIAALHADSWRVAYRGLLPDTYLDDEVLDDRTQVWRQRFDDVDYQRATVTIVAEAGDELSGFAHSFVHEDPKWGTLLDNLHVRPGTKRLGIGTRLVAETAAWLQQRAAAAPLYLWVLEGNLAARRFYDSLGGQRAGNGISQLAGGAAPKLRYWWPQLDRLSALLPQERQPLG